MFIEFCIHFRVVGAFNGIFQIGITDLFMWALITIATLMLSLLLELVKFILSFVIRNDSIRH